MRRSRATLLGAGLVLASVVSASVGSAAADTPVLLYNPSVPIDVVLTARVSSEIAKPGDEFYFKTLADVNLGKIDVPAGTPGLGRLDIASPATRDANGQLALQADYITVGDTKVWVNIDTTVTPRGHLSTRRDLVLDPGMKFRVTTILPRKGLATLVQTPPSPTADVPTTGSPAKPGLMSTRPPSATPEMPSPSPAASEPGSMEPQPSASPSP